MPIWHSQMVAGTASTQVVADLASSAAVTVGKLRHAITERPLNLRGGFTRVEDVRFVAQESGNGSESDSGSISPIVAVLVVLVVGVGIAYYLYTQEREQDQQAPEQQVSNGEQELTSLRSPPPTAPVPPPTAPVPAPAVAAAVIAPVVAASQRQSVPQEKPEGGGHVARTSVSASQSARHSFTDQGVAAGQGSFGSSEAVSAAAAARRSLVEAMSEMAPPEVVPDAGKTVGKKRPSQGESQPLDPPPLTPRGKRKSVVVLTPREEMPRTASDWYGADGEYAPDGTKISEVPAMSFNVNVRSVEGKEELQEFAMDDSGKRSRVQTTVMDSSFDASAGRQRKSVTGWYQTDGEMTPDGTQISTAPAVSFLTLPNIQDPSTVRKLSANASPGGMSPIASPPVGGQSVSFSVRDAVKAIEKEDKTAMAEKPAEVTLGQWVATLRKTVASGAGGVTLVAGNEASDADSIVTAQVYGYLKQHTAAEGDGPVIPVVACNREDVKLRRETVLLLKSCGVDCEDLVFLDDSGIDALLARVSCVTLVDHNKATGPLEALGDKVVEIKDHHKDLGAHPNASGGQREIAFEGDRATAASACSVITEAYLACSTGRELLARDNAAVARALLGVILIDSANLDPEAGKVCDRDSAAAGALMDIAPDDEEELFQSLDSAKFDAGFWDGLSIQQCFRYDYKEFASGDQKYGLASCLCSLEALAGKEFWEEEVATRGSVLDVFGVLTQVKEPGSSPSRQLMLYANDAAAAEEVAKFAQAYDRPSLELEAFELKGPAGTHAFAQKNVSASRKQVQPCLGMFFDTRAKADSAPNSAEPKANEGGASEGGKRKSRGKRKSKGRQSGS